MITTCAQQNFIVSTEAERSLAWPNYSLVHCLDTGKTYHLCNAAWHQVGSAGGPGGSPVGSLVASVWRSATMTNIGSAYKDIYSATAFDAEHLAWIDFTSATQCRIVFIWDYIGTGAQQVRWVDMADNANVLWESGTFTADQDPADSGWFAIPAAFQGAMKKIEWQGKSTVAADDPISKGYAIYLR